MNEHIVLEETRKKHKKTFYDHEKSYDQSHCKVIKECIKQFNSSIAVESLLYVHAAIKHGLGKVFAC